MADDVTLYLAMSAFKKRHPVRKEVTGERNLEFSQYVRKHCRPSKVGCVSGGVEWGGFVPIDLDWIVHDYHHKLLQLLEVKTNNGKVAYSQRQTLQVLDSLLRLGAQSKQSAFLGYTYLGCHTLIMDGTTPENSKVIKWDDEIITRLECWRRINMLDAVAAKKKAA